jgi:protein-S-isoprenylcysteine O-methyltransferase Ste14
MGSTILLVARVVVYELALGFLLVIVPLWFALGSGAQLGILPEWVQAPGLLVALAGGALWLWATVELAVQGRGTPLPLDPPVHLVTTGPYARIRNPMHVGLAVFLAGVALLFRSPAFLVYAGIVTVLVWAYARWVEVHALERRYGEMYRRYRARVPAWWPGGRPRRVRTSAPFDSRFE